MRRFRLKALLALVLAVCLSISSLPSGFAFADELETESTEAPFWESLDDEAASEFDVTSALTALEEPEEEAAYSDDDSVRVFIVFEDESVVEAGYSTENVADNKEAMNYSDALEATQNEVIEKIEEEVLDGTALEKNHSFTLFTNAVSADVKYKDLEEIEAIDGVSAVYIAPVYNTLDTVEPQTMTAGEMVGSYRTWESGYTGAGMRVAVIDTGLDVNHPSFSEDGFLYGLNETAAVNGKSVASYDLLDAEEIAGVLDKLNATANFNASAEDLYVNAKVPFGFNYVDNNLDLKHLIKSDGTHDDHGSHVAGIATANKYINYDGEYSTQKLGVVGIAPDAQLFVMRVFGQNGGAYTDDYMAAIEDAILLGADSVNLSLGSANAGETASGEAYIDEIFDRIATTDTVVVISAGNSGSFADSSTYGANLTTDVSLDTVGSPGSYTNAFTVASATNSSYTGYASVFNDTQVVNYQDGSSANNAPLASLDVNGTGTEYEYVLIPSYGEEKDFKNVDVEGKIAIVSRGEISFYVKHMNAAKAGAVGLLVYNNTTGTIGMNLTGSDATIPAASITLAAAQEIASNSVYNSANGTYTGKVVISSELVINYNVPDAFLMSDFSSWGVPGDLTLKPEITAPGGNIYSTTDEGTYSVYSGTSMAAPSVAGLTALVKQYIEENNLVGKSKFSSRVLAQSLLMSTATPLKQADGILYSPRKQGAGLANAAAATSSPAYIVVGSEDGNDGKVKAELGDDPERTGQYQFDFTIYNVTGEHAYYKFDATALTESVLEEYFIGNSSKELNADISYSVGSANTVYLYDIDNDGAVNTKDVNALMRYVNAHQKNSKIETFPEAFDFNKNGVVNITDAALFLQALSKKTSAYNFNEKVIVAKSNRSTKVTVTVKLTDADKNYLNSNFENGMYVDGFVQLDSKVDLTVPFLAFYGNWSDASMFDPYDGMLALAGDENQLAYNGVNITNYLTVQFRGDSSSYYFAPNMYEDDEEYIPDRNSLASGDKLAKFNFTLIRNAGQFIASVTNAETGEQYLYNDFGAADATYYSVNQGAWQATRYSVGLNWAGKDANNQNLPDGTKVNVTLTAIPSYYQKNPEAPLGKGINYTIPVTIDNTKPVAELVDATEAEKDVSGNVVTPGKMTIKVSDNRYVAAVYVVNSDQTDLINSYAINQKEAGVETELTFEYPNQVFYLYVMDYAGNTSIIRVNASDEPDAEIVESLELSSEYLTVVKGGTGKLTATLKPDNLADSSVTWMSLDPSIAIIDENGVVTGVSVGKTVVGAVTNALGADGEPLIAACEVEVITIEADLNTTLWDEVGDVYFGTFNTSDLKLNNLSEAQDVRFNATAVVDGVLYATTIDNSDGDASLYKVDPSTFEAELVANDLIENVDLAYGLGTGYLYAAYDGFVLVETLDGVFDGYYSIYRSYEFEGEYVTGIASVGTYYDDYYECPVDVFLMMDDAGNLYEWEVYGELGFILTKLGATGISTDDNWEYDSLYYDDETGYAFYSCYDGTDDVTLYALALTYSFESNSYGVLTYNLGQFPSRVWPVSGLYQWDSENDANYISVGLKALRSGEATLNTEKSTTGLVRRESSNRKPFNPPVKETEEAVVAPAEEAPVEATPAEEEAPAEEAPVEEAPAEDVSENEAEAPVEEAPAEEVPAEEP